jgi:formate dehydrogenase iron-sulfur subunit
MKRVFVNIDRCIACRTCSAACDYSHNEHRPTIGYGELREDVRLPFICRHCEEPACLAACPQGAIKKLDNGAIKRMNMLCTGCGSCAVACPFGVIEPEVRSYVISKCDLCASRLKEGREPACVMACPADALTYEEADEVAGKSVMISSSMKGRHPFFRRV